MPTNDPVIRTIAERKVYDDPANPFVTLYYDDVEWPDGSRGRYNRIVEGTGRPGVVVLPLVDDEVALVRVFRYPLGRASWEAPRGFGEGPSAIEDAERELREETGWRGAELHGLGTINLNSGLLAGSVEVFAARVDPQQPRATTSGHEVTEVRLFEPEALARMVLAGDLPDAATQSALLLASLRGLLTIGRR